MSNVAGLFPDADGSPARWSMIGPSSAQPDVFGTENAVFFEKLSGF